jgi:hypothetical protein
MENFEQSDGATVDRHGDTKVESLTVTIKAMTEIKSAILKQS